MSDIITTQLYITIPASLNPEQLIQILEDAEISCVRCIYGEEREDQLDSLREACHDRDIPLVIEAPDALAVDIARRHGLDGIHISALPKTIAYARKTLGEDAIIGANAGTSRHDGMLAAEAGADYIAFGPLSEVDTEMLVWWSQVVETPLVAETASPEQAQSVTGIADFICVGEAIWDAESPIKALRAYSPS